MLPKSTNQRAPHSPADGYDANAASRDTPPGTRRWFVAAAALLALAASARQATARCADDFEGGTCMRNGQQGTLECLGGRPVCIIDEPPAPKPQSVAGILAPKYYVLTVVYAPPGTNGGRSTSNVAYGSGSSTGSTTSTASSFKQNYKISASAEGGIIGDFSVGGSFSYGRSTTDSRSIDVKKANTTTIRSDGPSVDGIDHDRDQIWVWLNPRVKLTLQETTATWTFAGDQPAHIQFLFVGWLKNPATMPQGVRQALEGSGITPTDYAGIMAHDPFANGPITPDPARFVSLNATLPYEPPFSATDPVPTTQINISSSWTQTLGNAAQDDYEVGLSIAVGGNFLGFAKASLKNEDTWHWTNASVTSNATGTAETATATIGGPAFGYTGPTQMEVYFDKVYKTILFRPLQTNTVALRGRLTVPPGQSLFGREVTAMVDGVVHRTFTNTQGDYRFPGQFAGPVRLQSGPVVRNLPQIGADQPIELQLR